MKGLIITKETHINKFRKHCTFFHDNFTALFDIYMFIGPIFHVSLKSCFHVVKFIYEKLKD